MSGDNEKQTDVTGTPKTAGYGVEHQIEKALQQSPNEITPNLSDQDKSDLTGMVNAGASAPEIVVKAADLTDYNTAPEEIARNDPQITSSVHVDTPPETKETRQSQERTDGRFVIREDGSIYSPETGESYQDMGAAQKDLEQYNQQKQEEQEKFAETAGQVIGGLVALTVGGKVLQLATSNIGALSELEFNGNIVSAYDAHNVPPTRTIKNLGVMQQHAPQSGAEYTA
ncbi:MAG: hypothetical protein H6908_01290 [Hyphomicrobiales bacterium]|nr:hypothetical protein [Hyphomicrobiales bacterium]